MGDHRAEFHAAFTIGGKTHRLDLDWVNWSPSRCSEVSDWIGNCWDEYMAKWLRQRDIERSAEEAEKIAAAERAELARLKAKYEKP